LPPAGFLNVVVVLFVVVLCVVVLFVVVLHKVGAVLYALADMFFHCANAYI